MSEPWSDDAIDVLDGVAPRKGGESVSARLDHIEALLLSLATDVKALRGGAGGTTLPEAAEEPQPDRLDEIERLLHRVIEHSATAGDMASQAVSGVAVLSRDIETLYDGVIEWAKKFEIVLGDVKAIFKMVRNFGVQFDTFLDGLEEFRNQRAKAEAEAKSGTAPASIRGFFKD